MEVCGGQTHTILKTGLTDLLPDTISLVHGPGCPVCVTPVEQIDKAVTISLKPEVIFTSFGDMLRVPGSEQSLFDARAEGADVRIVYSPMDALKLARANPERQVVFFAVGFETTAPANAMSVWQAAREGLKQLLRAGLARTRAAGDGGHSLFARMPRSGFSRAGPRLHCRGLRGVRTHRRQATRAPIVVTGFEPVDILRGILRTVELLEAASPVVENAYSRAVRREGNPAARARMTGSI